MKDVSNHNEVTIPGSLVDLWGDSFNSPFVDEFVDEMNHHAELECAEEVLSDENGKSAKASSPPKVFTKKYTVEARRICTSLLKRKEENKDFKVMPIISEEIENNDLFDVLEFADVVKESRILKTILQEEAKELFMFKPKYINTTNMPDWV